MVSSRVCVLVAVYTQVGEHIREEKYHVIILVEDSARKEDFSLFAQIVKEPQFLLIMLL